MRLPPPIRSLCLLALLPSAALAQSTSASPAPEPATPQSSTAQSSAPSQSTAQSSTTPLPIPQATTSAPVSARQRRKAEDAFLAGARHMDRNDPLAAMADFTRAVALNPANTDYQLALAVAREHRVTQLVQQAGNQRLQGHIAQADALLQQARTLDPDNKIVTQHFDSPDLGTPLVDPYQIPSAARFAGPLHLTPSLKTASFHFRLEPSELVRAVATAYGITTIFDSSILMEPDKQARLDLDDVTYDQAMSIVLTMTQTFAVPVDSTRILVAKDTPDNRQRLEPLLLETISVPSESTAQINELSTMIKNIFELKQVSVAPNAGSLVVRAPEQTLKAINLTLGDMLDGGSEVMLDMRIFSLANTHNLNMGVALPQSLGAYNIASSAQSAISANQSTINQAISSGLLTLNGNSTQNFFTELAFLFEAGLLSNSQFSDTLAIFGGGITTTGIFSGGASLNFGLNSSDTRALEAIQTRISDRQDTTLRIGTRYPIATAIYSSSVPALPSSIANATINGTSVQSLLNSYGSAASSIPQFSYEDLGLTLKVTPSIQKSNLVTLKLDLKIEALSGGSINTVPILDNTSLSSTITVADGSTALIASNLTKSQSDAVAGTPGLSELPGFQDVPNDNRQTATSRLVILITPYVVRRRSPLLASRPILLNLPHVDPGY